MRPALIITALTVALCAMAPLQLGCAGSSRKALTAREMPAGGSYTGVWFSPQYGEMHLEQSGNAVVGRYAKDERTGRIQGTVEGDLMRFEWTESRELIAGHPVETRGHGYFHIRKSESEDTWNLEGEWGHDDDESGGGPWTAVKSKTRKPDISGSGEEGTPASSGGESSYDDDGATYEGSDDSGSGGSDVLDNL